MHERARLGAWLPVSPQWIVAAMVMIKIKTEREEEEAEQKKKRGGTDVKEEGHRLMLTA